MIERGGWRGKSAREGDNWKILETWNHKGWERSTDREAEENGRKNEREGEKERYLEKVPRKRDKREVNERDIKRVRN